MVEAGIPDKTPEYDYQYKYNPPTAPDVERHKNSKSPTPPVRLSAVGFGIGAYSGIRRKDVG